MVARSSGLEVHVVHSGEQYGLAKQRVERGAPPSPDTAPPRVPAGGVACVGGGQEGLAWPDGPAATTA